MDIDYLLGLTVEKEKNLTDNSITEINKINILAILASLNQI